MTELALSEGNVDQARAFAEESEMLFRELDDRRGIAVCTCHWGMIAHADGDTARARSLFSESLRLFQVLADSPGIVESVEALAGLSVDQGDAVRAATLWGACASYRQSNHYPQSLAAENRQKSNIARARTLVDDSHWESGWNEGSAMTIEHAARHALADAGEVAGSMNTTPQLS